MSREYVLQAVGLASSLKFLFAEMKISRNKIPFVCSPSTGPWKALAILMSISGHCQMKRGAGVEQPPDLLQISYCKIEEGGF